MKTALEYLFPKQLASEELLERVWGPAYVKETQYLRVYLGQLRRKLEADPGEPTLITTQRGAGYLFTASVEML